MAPESDTTRAPLARPRPPAARKAPPAWARYVKPRTLKGFGVAMGVAVLVLLQYHVVRPFCARHGIRTSLDEDVIGALKAVLAFSTLSLAVWALVRRLERRPFKKRVVTAVMAVCGALGVAAYVGSDDLGATNFIHRWELFHYYLGSKYPKELGYKRLYLCAAIAQSEFGPMARAEVEARKIRDLETDVMEQAAPVLLHPEKCKSHFTPERWASFKEDVEWFRSTSSKDFWEGMSTDHGYNPPPVWTTIGHVVDYFSPAATRTSMTVLASIDTFLFATLFFSVWWAFGGPTCATLLVFWGTQLPANGYFTGGAYLRQDWVLLLVLSACLLRKHYWASAGAALAASALLRVFPAIFFAGIAVVAYTHYRKHKRFAPHHVRVFAGAAAATGILFALSLGVTGPQAYRDFAAHIELHHRTPATNNMGLSVLLSFTPEGRAHFTRDPKALDEFGKWAEVHTNALARRRPAFLAINAFIALIFYLAVRRVKTLWIAMGLSAILVVSVPTLSCYYYSFLLVPALLSKVNLRLALLSLFVSGLSSLLLIIGRTSFQFDDRFTLQSVLFVGYAFALVLAFLPPNQERPKVAAAGKALPEGAR